MGTWILLVLHELCLYIFNMHMYALFLGLKITQSGLQ